MTVANVNGYVGGQTVYQWTPIRTGPSAPDHLHRTICTGPSGRVDSPQRMRSRPAAPRLRPVISSLHLLQVCAWAGGVVASGGCGPGHGAARDLVECPAVGLFGLVV